MIEHVSQFSKTSMYFRDKDDRVWLQAGPISSLRIIAGKNYFWQNHCLVEIFQRTYHKDHLSVLNFKVSTSALFLFICKSPTEVMEHVFSFFKLLTQNWGKNLWQTFCVHIHTYTMFKCLCYKIQRHQESIVQDSFKFKKISMNYQH